MSRVGKIAIKLPTGVKAGVSGGNVSVEGPLGRLEHTLEQGIAASVDAEKGELKVTRPSNSKLHKMQHGLHRALVQNMVIGVTEGYKKELEVIGIGYNVRLDGNTLSLDLGFANTIKLPVPKGIKVEIAQATNPGKLTISGINKHDVGQFAALARAARPPEPYQGKGVRYLGEAVRRKAGKALVGSG
jgi:large subunit ribosomal protein L6